VDRTAASLEQVENQRNADFLILRQGLGYCWSTAVAALPVEGRALMEKWLVKSDRDIEWIMKENLKKARLARMDANWVKQRRSRLEVWTVPNHRVPKATTTPVLVGLKMTRRPGSCSRDGFAVLAKLPVCAPCT